MGLLTDHEKILIKHEIGNVFRNLLQYFHVRQVLKTKIEWRKPRDIRLLVKLLTRDEYIKELKLDYSSLAEMTNLLHYKEYQPGEEILKHGEPVDKFDVIVKGRV